MSIRFIVPCFNATDDLEAASRDRLYTWAKRLNFDHLTHIGITVPKYPRSGPDAWQRQKGVFVRNTLIEINKDGLLNDDIIVLIDGSGKIKFNSALQVVRELQRGIHNVVMGVRGDNWAIDPDRKAVELFENSTIETHFSCILPDAQCGTWGFRGGALKGLPFIANAYEIELDLIISTLEEGHQLGFVEVQVDQALMTPHGFSTQFNPTEQHKRKLQFLADKLNYSGGILRVMAHDFQKQRGIRLPKKYVQLFSGLTIPKHKRKFPIQKWAAVDEYISS